MQASSHTCLASQSAQTTSALLSGKTSGKIGKIEHILKDTYDLKTKLGKAVISSETFFYKIDIKDFYMSGDHADIISHSSYGCDVVRDRKNLSEKKAFGNGVRFVLKNQYVVMKSGDRQAWQVVKGSGMGLIASDELSNLDFYEKSRVHVHALC